MKKSKKNLKHQQELYIGIDVHLRNWSVCIRSCGMVIKSFSCEPSPEKLFEYLNKHFPGFIYFSVYEAGFCGFAVHYKLCELGIKNIVVNPADVGTTNKEKLNKSDAIDCKKLARELEQGNLIAIYIPSGEELQYRSLFRYRQQLAKDLRKAMLRATSFIYTKGFYYEGRNWSVGFRKWVEELKLNPLDRYTLDNLLLDVLTLRKKSKGIMSYLTKELNSHPKYGNVYKKLIGIPGIGPICTVALICELIDMKRFSSEKKLASYIGLIPSIRSSDKKSYESGIHHRAHRVLRTLLIQSAWVSLRNDSELLVSYTRYIGRMKAQKAIIKVARKVLNRIRHVWLNDTTYEVRIAV